MKAAAAQLLAVSLILPLIAGPSFVRAQETAEAAPVETSTEPMPVVPLTSTSETTLIPEETVATSTEESLAPVEASTTPVIVEEISAIDPSSYVPGEIIVKFEDGVDTEVLEDHELDTESVVEDQDTAIVSTDEDSVAETVAALEADDRVLYAEPNYVRSLETLASTTDTDAFRLWALENTGQDIGFGITGTADVDTDADKAWDISTGSGIIVAVIDTGVDYTHPDLSANMWDGTNCVDASGAALGGCLHGYDFADDDKNPMPITASTSYEHGTHVAGIIAAARNNAEGGIGIAPDVKIMALRFGLDTGSEVEAIHFAMKNGAKIINASFSGSGRSQAEYDAIKAFQDAGGIFVASAANGAYDGEGDDLDDLPDEFNRDHTAAYPAMHDLDGIITVAATDMNDELTSFSNYGAQSVDLAAPGDYIWSTVPASRNFYEFKGGTSMAAPLVAGAVALLESKYPQLSASTVKNAILEGGDAIPALAGKTVSGKRLNAYTPLLDTIAPVITLNGANPLNITQNSTFTDPGVSVTDNRDTAPTVTTSGSVDAATIGSYTLTYIASDASGNTSSTTREVIVSGQQSSGGGGGGGGSKSKSKKKSGGGGGSSKPKAVLPPATTTGKVLGASTTAPLTDADRQKLIASLMEQVRILMQKLLALQAAGR